MGTYIYPIWKNFLNLSGGTVTGNTYFQASLSADTIFSGSTELSLIFGDKHWKPGSSGNYSIRANNNSTIDATGNYAIAEGYDTSAFGDNSHVEGVGSITYGVGAHAEGVYTTAYDYAHSEGIGSTAVGIGSHAEGLGGTASGNYSHVQGSYNNNTGENSFVGGNNSSVYADNSFVFGASHILYGQRSAIIGGQNITGTNNDTVYVPYLNVNLINSASTTDYFLTRSSTGEIKLSSLNYISIGAVTGGTFGDTTRFNGSTWIANNFLYNNGTSIGINNTSPSATLQIKGADANSSSHSFKINDSNNNNIFSVRNDGLLSLKDGGTILFGTGSTPFITNSINSSGIQFLTSGPTQYRFGWNAGELWMTGNLNTGAGGSIILENTTVGALGKNNILFTDNLSLYTNYAWSVGPYSSEGLSNFGFRILNLKTGTTIPFYISNDVNSYVGINNVSPIAPLDVSGKTRTTNFQMLSGASTGYVLTAVNSSGDAYWAPLSGGDSTTYISNGLNTYTGGTTTNPTVNISGGTFDSLTVTGATSLSSLFATDFILASGPVNAGYKLTALNSLGNSYWAPDISIYGSGTTGYLVKTLYANSGNTIVTVENSQLFEDTSNLKADVINDDYSIKLKTNNISSAYSSELEIKTEVGNPSLNLFVSAFEGDAGLLLKEGKINLKSISISANTEGNIKIDSLGNLYSDGTIETHVQPGTNIFTGGTASNPTINVYGLTISDISGLQTSLDNKANLSGATFTGSITAVTLSATTLFSGSTELGSLFATPAQLNRIQNGLNTYTGGTVTNPTVNISGGTFANINASGNSVFNTLSANTITSPVIVGGSGLTSGIIYSASSSTAITTTAVAHSFQGGPSGLTVFASINHTGKTIFNASGVAIPAYITKNFALIDDRNSTFQIGSPGSTSGYTNVYFGAFTPSSSNYTIQSDGSSYYAINNPTLHRFQISAIDIGRATVSKWSFTPQATSAGAIQFELTAAAHTSIAASADTPTVNFNLSANRQFATGPKTSQTDFLIQAPTYSAVGATTTTDAYTFVVSGSPTAGTNMTITNSWAAWLNGPVKINSGLAGFIFRPDVTTSNFASIYYTNATPSGTNHIVKYNGGLFLNAQSSSNLQLQINATPVVTVNQNSVTVTPVAAAAGGTSFTVTTPANTAVVASTDVPGVYFNFSASTKQFATGAKSTQSEFRIDSPIYSAVGATTITDASTLYVNAAPSASTNVTITNSWAAWLNGNVKFGRGINGFIFTTNPGNGWNGIYNANVTPSGSNYMVSSNGVSTSLNATSAGAVTISNNGSSVLFLGSSTILGSKAFTLTPAVVNGGAVNLTVNGAAHTSITASADTPAVLFNLSSTKQFATGTKSTQSEFRITPPTYSAVGATTTTDAYTFTVAGPPSGGTNMTITNTYAAWLNGFVKIGSGATGWIFSDTGSGTYAALYSTNVPPGAGNFIMRFGGGAIFLNGSTNQGNISLSYNNSAALTISSTLATFAFPAVLKAGTAAVNGAPLYFNTPSSVLLTTPSTGAMEASSDGQLFYSQSGGTNYSRSFIGLDSYTAKTSNYTATTLDHTIDCTSGTFTVTLPNAGASVNGVPAGRIYRIINTGTGVITIDTTGGQTINGAASQSLSTQYSGISVQSTGTNWIILSKYS